MNEDIMAIHYLRHSSFKKLDLDTCSMPEAQMFTDLNHSPKLRVWDGSGPKSRAIHFFNSPSNNLTKRSDTVCCSNFSSCKCSFSQYSFSKFTFRTCSFSNLKCSTCNCSNCGFSELSFSKLSFSKFSSNQCRVSQF